MGILEEMVIQHMAETDREKFKDMCFNISFGEEQVELTSYLSYKKEGAELLLNIKGLRIEEPSMGIKGYVIGTREM